MGRTEKQSGTHFYYSITKIITQFPTTPVAGMKICMIELYLWKFVIYRKIKTVNTTYTIATIA
ncbi:hypothetical protein FACS1894162_0410 [Bacteroidia bacterium]|nr:hypothetical protein FACS1894162_0410 [Bacteroidia bacterium]